MIKDILERELKALAFTKDCYKKKLKPEDKAKLYVRVGKKGPLYQIGLEGPRDAFNHPKTKMVGGPDNIIVHNAQAYAHYEEMLKRIEANEKALRKCLNQIQDYSEEAVQAALSWPYRNPYYWKDGDPVWMKLKGIAKQPYDKNSYQYDDPACLALDGTKVRSKSEAIIYNMLLQERIPFQYDKTVTIQTKEANVEASFDFLIPAIDRDFGWEYLGLLKDPAYCSRTANKLQRYAVAGFIPFHNLILTGDMSATAIDSELVREIIVKIIKPRVRTPRSSR